MNPFSEQVSIVRARRVPGDYGGWREDWADPEVIPVTVPVSVQPVSTADVVDTPRRHAVTATHALYSLPPHTLDDLRDTDRIRVAGWPYDLDIEGRPQHWRTEMLAHTEVDLKEHHG